MYPVAPVSLVLFVKRISDFLDVTDNPSFVRTNLLRLITTHNRAGGWLAGQTKPYPLFEDYYERGAMLGALSLSESRQCASKKSRPWLTKATAF